MRNRHPVAPYSRTMPMAVLGREAVSYARETPVSVSERARLWIVDGPAAGLVPARPSHSKVTHAHLGVPRA